MCMLACSLARFVRSSKQSVLYPVQESNINLAENHQPFPVTLLMANLSTLSA